MTDCELLISMHAGDANAARELWSRLGPRLVAYVRAMLGRGPGGALAGADADDVVQTAFTRVLLLDAARVRAIEDAGAYLAQAARRAVMNASRETSRRRRRERQGGGVADAAASAPLTEDAGVLMAAVDELHPDDREMLLLKHVACLTFDQMAVVLEENRSTIASRYRAAVGRLRGAMAGGGAARPTSDPAASRQRGASHVA